MILRHRMQWILRTALLLFIFSSVAFLSALTAMRLAIQGREVTMPDLTGKQSSEAERALQDRHLGLQVEDKVYSELPRDAVIRQSPPANMRVKAGQDAHVILSLGPQHATIPALQDLSLRAAQVDLLRGGMQLGEVSSMDLPGSSADTIVQQDPAPGTSDVTSPHVNLLVSIEPPAPAYVMPDLTGLPIAEAQLRLRVAGLKTAVITSAQSQEFSAGIVAAQVPARGQRVDANTVITLQIAASSQQQ